MSGYFFPSQVYLKECRWWNISIFIKSFRLHCGKKMFNFHHITRCWRSNTMSTGNIDSEQHDITLVHISLNIFLILQPFREFLGRINESIRHFIMNKQRNIFLVEQLRWRFLRSSMSFFNIRTRRFHFVQVLDTSFKGSLHRFHRSFNQLLQAFEIRSDEFRTCSKTNIAWLPSLFLE